MNGELTMRQREFLRALAHADSLKAAADAMGLTSKGCEYHCAVLQRKLKRLGTGPATGPQAVSLLRALGINNATLGLNGWRVPRARRHGGFWARDLNYLEILEVARRTYRRRITQEHPDRGGSPEKAARLNLLWSTIRRLFSRRGYVLER